jgi:hypothetical protein
MDSSGWARPPSPERVPRWGPVPEMCDVGHTPGAVDEGSNGASRSVVRHEAMTYVTLGGDTVRPRGPDRVCPAQGPRMA